MTSFFNFKIECNYFEIQVKKSIMEISINVSLICLLRYRFALWWTVNISQFMEVYRPISNSFVNTVFIQLILINSTDSLKFPNKGHCVIYYGVTLSMKTTKIGSIIKCVHVLTTTAEIKPLSL
jgi:hypothetical protein